MTPEQVGCTHGYEDGNGFPSACPECLEREIESLREVTRIAVERAVQLRGERDRLELLAGEQGELIGKLRMAIPVDSPPLKS